MQRMKIVGVGLLVLLTSIACTTLMGGAERAPEPPPALDSDLPTQIAGDGFSMMAGWPDYLPDDIPPLDGDIRIVMGSPETNVRIFYESLTEREIDRYVETCQDQGFTVEYFVYTREGFPDRSQEKLKAGEYDAVEFSKGSYQLRLEYGGDSATLDIHLGNTTGQARPTAAPLPWPEDIEAAVPQPAGCQVGNIANLSYGGYQIACEFEDGHIRLDEYVQTLTDLGFQETDRLISDTNEIVNITLENGDLIVILMPHPLSSTLTLQIKPGTP